MCTNPKESGEKFYKNTNAQLVQITSEERFLTQSKNNLTVKNKTYKDITLNQTQSEQHRNLEIRQYQDIENRSINTIENQLIELRQKQQEKFTQIKKTSYIT